MKLYDLKLLAVVGFSIGLISAIPAHAVVISASNSVEGVFDPDPGSAPDASGTRTVAFSAADLGGAINSILDVNIAIDFMKCADDTPTTTLTTPLPANCPISGSAYAREIIFRLTSPGGIQVSLVEPDTYFPGGSDPDPGTRITVTFDDAAADLVGSTGFVGGAFFPVGSLSAFNGEGAVGTWSLYIEDDTGQDPLGFASFRLDVEVQDQSSTKVPEPGTAFLLAFGFAGLAARRRYARQSLT